jgi:hypothetical protein
MTCSLLTAKPAAIILQRTNPEDYNTLIKVRRRLPEINRPLPTQG